MEILKRLGIKTNNKNIYKTAFTHTSYSNEHHEFKSYERLEFLGDAVLESIISDYLYNNKNLEEGFMTKIRATYVCEKALFNYAKDLKLYEYLKLGSGEHDIMNETILADVFEAFIGALYIDKGYDITKKIVLNIIIPYIESNYEFMKDYKSKLQEMVQTVKKSVVYEVIKESGPAHDKTFTVRVKVDGIIMGKGIAKSKKEAEQMAAMEALSKQAK